MRSTNTSRHQKSLFASKIVKYHFGPPSESICKVLASKGTLPLRELETEAGLSHQTAQNALRTLIQQNIVHSALSPMQKLVYSFDVESTVLRLRYPRFLAHVNSELGDMAEKVMQTLVDNGRLTFDYMYDFSSAAAQEKLDRDTAFKAFSDMVKKGFLERQVVPNMEKKEIIREEEESAPASRKSKKKRTAPETNVEEDETSRPSKRPLSSLPNFCETEIKGVPFIINPTGFLWDFRAKSIAEHCVERYGDVGGLLASLLLDIGREDYVGSRASISHRRNISSEEIFAKIEEMRERGQIQTEQNELIRKLGDLSSDDTLISSHGNSYSLNLQKITQLVKQRQVESIIESKFGLLGRRIFRILLEKKQIETAAMWEVGMVPVKEGHRILFQMQQSNYVSLQELARSVDTAANRKFYLWSTDLSQVCSVLTLELFKTANNLITRIDCEKNKAYQLVGPGGEVASMLPESRAQYEQITRGIEALQGSLCRLDETIMILSEY